MKPRRRLGFRRLRNHRKQGDADQVLGVDVSAPSATACDDALVSGADCGDGDSRLNRKPATESRLAYAVE